MTENNGKIYIAAPWFREGQGERLDKIKSILINSNVPVFSPRDENLVADISNKDDRRKSFMTNVSEVRNSKAVLAITNGLDAGTIFEAGVAYEAGVPVFYFAEGLERGFNLMLAESAAVVFTDFKEVEEFFSDPTNMDNIMKDYDKDNRSESNYDGTIE